MSLPCPVYVDSLAAIQGLRLLDSSANAASKIGSYVGTITAPALPLLIETV
ncbi:capsid portal protein [Vibrio phage J14]|nr:capsid portal protein [Vibrio phage J14]